MPCRAHSSIASTNRALSPPPLKAEAVPVRILELPEQTEVQLEPSYAQQRTPKRSAVLRWSTQASRLFQLSRKAAPLESQYSSAFTMFG